MILSSFRIHAQEVSKVTHIFNSDPVLFNGRFYIFYPPPGTEGDQYLSGKQFLKGSLTLDGKEYTDLALNYDIYNQKVIYKYTAESGATHRIIIPDERIQSFSLGEKDFVTLHSDGKRIIIYQVLGNGHFRILYSWHKKLELNRFHGAINRVFSLPVKDSYLEDDGNLRMFRNNKTFLSLFPSEKKEHVRKFLREKRINVKKAADRSMEELIEYCNDL